MAHRIISLVFLILMAANAHAVFIEHLGSFGPGVEGGAEIAAYDSLTRRLFVTNASANTVDVYDLSIPAAVVTLPAIDLSALGDGPNSVAVANGVVAVAIQADPAQDPGVVAFFDSANGGLLNQVSVGALPDMVTFTPDGSRVLVANEGEPNDAYTVDPAGTISIIDVSGGIAAATVTSVEFSAFNVGQPRNSELPTGVRIFGPGATVAQDLEPEYIALDETGAVAYVSLQENNALAIIDVLGAEVLAIVDLGTKNHALAGNELDASNDDGSINIRNWPVSGFYQPDAIATVVRDGQVYVLSANEGDARDYDGFSEEFRVRDFDLDPTAFPDAADLQLDENLGRLRTTDQNGDIGGDGDFEQLFSYGARSFSVWDGTTGALLWDSGSDFERVTAQRGLPFFNADDSRSDDKGPEPEGIAIVTVGSHEYAAIGLERTGGFFLYDVTTPVAPQLVRYVASASSDVSPEGVLAINADATADGFPWLVVTHEVSGTIAVYRLIPPRAVPALNIAGILILAFALLFTMAAYWRYAGNERV